MWKTLRFRLAIWNILVVAVTALVTLAGLRSGVRWALLHEMDQILSEDTVEIALSLSEHADGEFSLLKEELLRKSVGHSHHGWFVKLLDSQNRSIWSSPESPNALKSSSVVSFEPSTLNGYRVVSRKVDPNFDRVSTLQVGASLQLLDEDMARIDRFILLTAGLVLVVAPLLGYWLAGRAAKTIGLITETAARLRPSHLDERLPINGTGDELDRLALTINRLLDRIAVDLQKKKDFLANAAHELRTPLAAIRSSVEVTLNSERSQQEYQDLLIEIIEQGSSLEKLVTQLLLLSESEAERLKFDLEPVDFSAIVQRTADMFEGVAESKEIELSVRIEPEILIQGSRHLLRQLANNLIDNAIKYTPQHGTIEIELVKDFAQNEVCFSVTDTGIGIPPEDLSKVFDRFYRADKSRTRFAETTGTGLGLSICKAVVDTHNGSIECASDLNHGTTIKVLLPFSNETSGTNIN